MRLKLLQKTCAFSDVLEHAEARELFNHFLEEHRDEHLLSFIGAWPP